MKLSSDKAIVRLSKFTFWYFTPLFSLVSMVLFYEIYDSLYLYILRKTRNRYYEYAGEVIFSVSIICSILVFAYAYKAYRKYFYKKIVLGYSWIPYVTTIVFIILSPRVIDLLRIDYLPGSNIGLYWIILFALPHTFLFIFIRIIIDNWINISKIFKKLSVLPLAIICSYVLLMFTSGRPGGEGAWWVLYALIIICPITSVVMYIIGWATSNRQLNKT